MGAGFQAANVEIATTPRGAVAVAFVIRVALDVSGLTCAIDLSAGLEVIDQARAFAGIIEPVVPVGLEVGGDDF